MGPPLGLSSGSADVKLTADTEKSKSPAGPLNIVVVNLDFNKNCWGTYKSHCGPMQKLVDECKIINPLPPRPYDAAVDN